MDLIEVEGLQIAYQRAGEGPPLVLLHGYVGDGPGTWAPQLEALSDGFTVVVWDAPGTGGSSDPPESFALSDLADRLAMFIDALGLERPHVGGVSFGGSLALELYRRHPAVPRSLILISAYAGWAGSLPREVVEQRLTQALRLADLPPDELVRAVVPTLFSVEAPPDAVERFAKSVSRFHPAGFRMMARALAEADLRDVLPDIDVPTLLISGSEDVRAPREVAEALHAAIRGSTLVVIPGAGHMCNLEVPERLDAEVRAFLRSLGS